MPERLSDFEWDDLKVFLALVRARSLRGAAQLLRTHHATLSRHLDRLEQAVDTRLFDRSKNGLSLTQIGEELLPYAQRIEDEIAAASRLVAGRDMRLSGTLHISLPPFLAVSSILDDLAAFGSAYENIELHLHVSDEIVRLAQREADISIRFAYDVTDDVVGRKLARCTRAAYCAPAYARRIEDNGGAGLCWIGWNEEEGAKSADWIKKSSYPKAILRHRVHEGLSQMRMAEAGAGLTFIPCFIGEAYPGLVRAPYQKIVYDRSLWLLLHKDLRKVARIRAFVDFLSARISARRAEFAFMPDA